VKALPVVALTWNPFNEVLGEYTAPFWYKLPVKLIFPAVIPVVINDADEIV
jgi:hypothetical protein